MVQVLLDFRSDPMQNCYTRAIRFILAAVLCTAPASALDVVTDSTVRYQTIEGWGTALWRETSKDPRFRAAYRDAGMNIVRLDMSKEVLVHSANDWATPVPLGSELQANVDQMNFRANNEIQAKAEFAQWLSQNALEPDRVKVSASPWTPPHWMKGPTGATQNFVGVTDNHPTPFLSNMVVPWQQNNPIPTGDSVGGRLKTEDPEILRQYGEYLAAWVTGFEQEYGVPIYTMSLQNESTFENPFDSMTFIMDSNGNRDFNQYAMGLKSVKDAWDAHGIDTKIMGPHVAHFRNDPSNPFGLWWQDEMIKGVKNHPDSALIDFLDFYNANFYNDTSEGNVKNVAGFYHGSTEVAPGEWTWHRPPGVKNDGQGIWYSETGGALNPWINGSGGSVGNGAITVALKMFNALVHSDASAYVYWQFGDGDGEISQHNLLGGASLDDPLSSNKYVAFNHFSRFVRPGAVRIESTFAGGDASVGGASKYDTLRSVNVSSFLHEEDQTLTYVLLNLTNSAEQITINLPEGLSVQDFDYYRSSETEQLEQLADLVVQNGQVSFAMPRYSLVTLVGSTLALPPLAGDYDGNGTVDVADYSYWKNAFGTSDAAADGNGDGLVDGADYTIWRDALGASADAATLESSAVPEPSTLALACLVEALAVARKRRARS